LEEIKERERRLQNNKKRKLGRVGVTRSCLQVSFFGGLKRFAAIPCGASIRCCCLHHHLQTTAPAAGVQVQHLKLTDLVYADDICLLASSPQHLQALIDALVSYCATLHIKISVAKTKGMVVSKSLARSPTPAAIVFTCNGLPVERVDTFKYLGLHFHASGDISHLITPFKAKAAGSWAVVQQRHSQLQCGNTVNLKLFLL